MRNITTALVVLILAAAGAIHTADSATAADQLPACHFEDGSGQAVCVWDGRHMGNGEGHSLVIRHGGTDSATYRVVTHRRAHRLINHQ